MNRETSHIPDQAPGKDGMFAVKQLALIVSAPDQSWLFPDDPFLNAGCRVLRATSLADAVAAFAMHLPTLLVLPLELAGTGTLACLKACLEDQPETTAIVVANNDQINDAAEAMRCGAFDCLFTPFSRLRLAKTIEAAMHRANSVHPIASTAPRPAPPVALPDGKSPSPAQSRHGLIGSDLAMAEVFHAIDTLAGSQASVFIRGENGTGKEVLARAIHANSTRSGAEFIPVDCATLTPETLFRDLFGTGDGPTGAAADAQGGTLFLDEVSNLDPRVQSQLLRFLQTGEIRPPEGNEVLRYDIRIISSTCRDPHEDIGFGLLREDLFYRLHVAPITLPPLRARGRDVIAIAQSNLRRLAQAEGRKFTEISPSATQTLMEYHWPGNVRQLLNVIWHVVLTHDGPQLTNAMLPEEIRTGHVTQTRSAPGDVAVTGRTLAQIERDVIESVIRDHDGSIPRAARVLDVSPSTIYRKREAWTKTKPPSGPSSDTS